MRAVRHHGTGGPEVLAIDEVPLPVPGPDQVRVRVAAMGLNRADLLQRMGRYPAPPGWPADIPGLEYAGVIDALGDGVKGLVAGQRVMGLVGGGAQAEYLVTGHREILVVPEGLDDPAAAAVPEAFLTAFDALARRGRVAAGERVLIHAAGSGVGTAAVQLARRMGAVVVVTSRTSAKLEQLRRLGADECVDTGSGPASAGVAAPVDVILDFLGAGALADNLAMLAPRGRLVLLGTLQGAIAERVDLSRVLRQRLEIIGAVMRTRAPAERIDLLAEFADRVVPDLAAGALRPVIGARFPVEAVREAHLAMESNQVFGKIVLTWTP